MITKIIQSRVVQLITVFSRFFLNGSHSVSQIAYIFNLKRHLKTFFLVFRVKIKKKRSRHVRLGGVYKREGVLFWCYGAY